MIVKAFIVLILPIWLFAIPLEVLIENAKNKHTSLKSLEQRVLMFDDDLEISQNFTDPMLSLSVSDIQLDDISDRSIERMQYTALNYQQKISYFGKRDALGDRVSASKVKARLSIDALKVKLIREIKVSAFSIWQIEEELKITLEYIKLTKQNIELYSATSTSDTRSHMSIMSAEMSLSELKIKKSRLASSLKSLYKKVSYLAGMNVKSIEMDMRIEKPYAVESYLDNKAYNISYKIKQASLDEANKDVKVKELDQFSDPVLSLGYFHRESFEDYINIGIGFSLPVYGTQDAKLEKSRKAVLANQSEMSDYGNKVLSKIHQVHAKLESSYVIHKIIEDESMPQIEHMFELSSSSIKNGDELFLYIELLEKKLSLDEKNIAVVASYHKNLARLEALIGEMK